jgi:hypothetical protein
MHIQSTDQWAALADEDVKTRAARGKGDDSIICHTTAPRDVDTFQTPTAPPTHHTKVKVTVPSIIYFT